MGSTILLQNLGKIKGAESKPDTYVELYLLPGKHKEVKTKTVKNDPNPLFAETIKFQVSALPALARMILIIELFKTFTLRDIVVPGSG